MPINSFLYPGAKVTPAYEVANSCRFNRADGPNMTKTPGSSGDLRKWTWSCWVKRGSISTGSQTMFNAGSSSNTQIRFDSDDTINFYQYNSGYTARLATNQKFRDPTAWLHIVAHWDTDNGTAGDRMKLFVNGSEVTSFATDTNPNQNLDSYFGASGTALYVGDKGDGAEEMDGYLAEVCFIDGQNLAPSSFGEFDEDSPTIWKPKNVSGLTFGTNGFYLDFEDSANLGNDANGGTDLTENNIAATDQATDTPTNNFCTLNPLNSVGTAGLGTVTMSEGNLQALVTDDFDTAFGTIGVQNGVWYYEVECDSTGSGYCAGWTTTDEMQSVGASGDLSAKFVGFLNDIRVMNWNTEDLADYGSISAGDILGLELDLDSGTQTLKCYHNGTLKDTANLPTDKGDTWIPIIGDTGTSDPTYKLNFGNPITSLSSAVNDPNGYGSFEYSTGSGYALCTKNLAEKG